MARRATFYIAPDGTVASVDTRPSVASAAEDSLRTLARLSEARRPIGGGKPVRAEKRPGRFAGPAVATVTMDALVPDFGLPDVRTGKTVALTSLSAGKKATVVLFVATQCPVSNAYNTRMARLAADYAPRGVVFVAINANHTEPSEEVAAHAQQQDFAFPVLKDTGNEIADRFGARRTPEAYVIDDRGILVYQGAIDDSQEPSRVKRRYLAAALDALLAGQPVSRKTTRAFGCEIKRATRQRPTQ